MRNAGIEETLSESNRREQSVGLVDWLCRQMEKWIGIKDGGNVDGESESEAHAVGGGLKRRRLQRRQQS